MEHEEEPRASKLQEDELQKNKLQEDKLQDNELQEAGTKNGETEDSTLREEEGTNNVEASSIRDAEKHLLGNGCIFQPVIYSFEIRPGVKPTSVMTAVEPPFYIYLDHAIAVIWLLFHKQKHQLGSDELLWCLRFLQKLKTCDGQYTDAVNTCMQTIEDYVIELYIKMGSGREENTTMSDVATKNDDILEGQTETIDANEPDSSGYRFSFRDVYSYMNIESSTTNKIQSASTFIDDKTFVTLASLTYNEMISRDSNAFIDETSNIERPLNISGTSTEYMGIASPKSSGLLNISPKLMNFLLSTRKLLIDRIKEELTELYNLEKFMGTIDGKSFTAYITEDLAKRLERLDSDNVTQADVTYMQHIVTKLINSLP